MNRQRRIHDAIVGLLVSVGAALAYWLDPVWLAIPGVVGLLLIQSGFTGFCPVYYTLDRLKIAQRAPAT
jgi:hypothetical protein